jgi:hypothetical protein
VRSFGEPYDSAGSLHFPSYANSFREFSIALPDARLTRDAAADAGAVLNAIRDGAFYSMIDALAGPAALRVAANAGSITVDAQAPDDAQITLFRNGVAVANTQGRRLEHAADAGVYRVEVTLPSGPGTPPVPWLMSNPVYVDREPEAPAPPRTSTASARTSSSTDLSGRGHSMRCMTTVRRAAGRSKRMPPPTPRSTSSARCRERSFSCALRFPDRRPSARMPRS